MVNRLSFHFAFQCPSLLIAFTGVARRELAPKFHVVFPACFHPVCSLPLTFSATAIHVFSSMSDKFWSNRQFIAYCKSKIRDYLSAVFASLLSQIEDLKNDMEDAQRCERCWHACKTPCLTRCQVKINEHIFDGQKVLLHFTKIAFDIPPFKTGRLLPCVHYTCFAFSSSKTHRT